MISEAVTTVAIRIRFSGSVEAERFHITPRECVRLLTEWKAYLGGNGAIGGEYAFEETDHPLVMSLNFSLIAYIEPGKVY